FHGIAPRVRLYTNKGRRSIVESVVFALASFRLLWCPAFDVLDVDQFPYTHFFAARLVCHLRRRPITATWHEVWDHEYWTSYLGWLAPVGFFLQRFAARSADVVFAPSRLTARRLTEVLGVEPSRVIILSPGIAVPSASPSPSGAGPGWGHKSIDCI